MSEENLIQYIDIEKNFLGKKPIFTDINLTINSGEFVFLTGISGAGKSTMFNLLLGTETPNEGRVIYRNYDVHKLPKRKIRHHRRSIGMVFQDYKLLTNKSSRENISIPLKIANSSKNDIDYKLNELALKLNIEHLLDQNVETLSGGEQQLVAIARAAIHLPDVILADEPTANLDQKMALKIFNIFERLNAEGITVIIATHDIHLIKSHKKKTVLLKNSGLIEVR
ncbi:MAG: ATP-binding cassette domain-containing protein [Deltaproteobacteria bacterium]|nr:ATP-binding cassette domain-containing protein [Deltaproteobacteria bacterium]MBT4527456.1 ATP-binding cassette domain-containing protein [Deltaproteobacteria bacterium]